MAQHSHHHESAFQRSSSSHGCPSPLCWGSSWLWKPPRKGGIQGLLEVLMSPRFQASCHTASRACFLWGVLQGSLRLGSQMQSKIMLKLRTTPSPGSFLQTPSLTPCLSRHFSYLTYHYSFIISPSPTYKPMLSSTCTNLSLLQCWGVLLISEAVFVLLIMPRLCQDLTFSDVMHMKSTLHV